VVSVLLTKAGVLLVCAGVMVIVLRGWLELGGGLLAIGLFAFLRVGYRYRSQARTRADDSETATETPVDDETGSETHTENAGDTDREAS